MPLLLIEHSRIAPGAGLVGETLREYGQKIRTVRLDRGESLPGDLDGIHGIVACDGPQSIAGDAGPLAAELALLRAAKAADLPILGLGLGARLFASALGGEIASCGGSPDLGWHPLTLSWPAREDPLFKGWPWTPTQCFWRREFVAKLPEGCVSLGSGPNGRIAGFSAGVFQYALDWSIDWRSGDVLEAARLRKDDVAATPGLGAEAVRAGTERFGPDAERLARRFAEQVALFLMPADRISAGRVKDLHY
jgi:GMP synthase-like glutamine amidotransferase